MGPQRSCLLFVGFPYLPFGSFLLRRFALEGTSHMNRHIRHCHIALVRRKERSHCPDLPRLGFQYKGYWYRCYLVRRNRKVVRNRCPRILSLRSLEYRY